MIRIESEFAKHDRVGIRSRAVALGLLYQARHQVNVSQLKALLAKAPDDTQVEVHFDMLDDEDPVIGTVKSASLALSVDKETVLVIDAVDAHPLDEDDEEEEGDAEE